MGNPFESVPKGPEMAPKVKTDKTEAEVGSRDKERAKPEEEARLRREFAGVQREIELKKQVIERAQREEKELNDREYGQQPHFYPGVDLTTQEGRNMADKIADSRGATQMLLRQKRAEIEKHKQELGALLSKRSVLGPQLGENYW